MTTTVLVVDDSKLARIVVGKALVALQPGWQRVEASNADEALLVLGSQPVSLALVDYNMPGRTGLELAAEIRALYPDMPIAVITANVQEEIIAAVHAVGAVFVSKPITEDGLRDFVAAAAAEIAARKSG
jgi:CheY-like chemotaxis protein